MRITLPRLNASLSRRAYQMSDIRAPKGSLPAFKAGQILRGKQWDYRVMFPEALKPSSSDEAASKNTNRTRLQSFIAEAVPHDATECGAPEKAFLATSRLGMEEGATLERNVHVKRAEKRIQNEVQLRSHPEVVSSGIFPTMYDVIDGDTVALELMETNMGQVPYQPHDKTSNALLKMVVQNTLKGFDLLGRLGYMSTALTRRLIYVSGWTTPQPTVKLALLSAVQRQDEETSLLDTPRFINRAPEIFLHQPFVPATQVWQLGAVLQHWVAVNKSRLGTHVVKGVADGSKPPFLRMYGYGIARLRRLFPHWQVKVPGEDRKTLQKQIMEGEAYYANVLPLEQELVEMGAPQEVRNLLVLILEVDPAKRPTPAQILASKEFASLDNLL